MEKTFLGIIGSPRRLGNSELIVKEIHRHLGNGWALRMMRLPVLDIRPCRACYGCLFGEMRCNQEDDFLPALDALAQADAYAVVAPTYLLAANAGLKRFMDRGLQFYAHLDRLWGKPAVAVAIAGVGGLEGSTKLDVERFVKMTFGNLKGSTVLYGALPGEVLLAEENRNAAGGLAEALTNPQEALPAAAPCCPLCGGDTFRFMPEGGLRCMLCSSSGKYRWEEGGLKIETHAGEHPLFLTYDDVVRHAQWLRGMKEMFVARKKELKAVVKDYIRGGSWVCEKPPKPRE
jgi:multimeric flavodoxin WrbA